MVDFFVCEKIILKDVIKIIKQEIQFEESLKQRIEFTRGFSKTFIKGSIRKIEKTNLSYIEPHKVIALAQTYFAVQTRKQEITKKEYNLLTEDEKRFYQRNLTRKGTYSLNQTAKKQELKILINFIMLVIKVYIMEEQLMILPKEKV